MDINYSTVFERGEDGYHTFRIPAVIRAGDGTLLAFAEGRVNGPGDDGNIDLVLKRSQDGGDTWGPLQVVVDDGGNKFGNPVPVVDRGTGRVVLNTTRTGGSVTGEDVICGRASAADSRRAFVQHSDDNGATWSEPREITADVKRPDWRHFVGGPGHGIRLTRGEHAGRLVIPGNHSVAPDEDASEQCTDESFLGGHSMYSDDGGQTWRLGGVDRATGVVNPNETTAAELGDGTVYFNTRDQNGTSTGARAATTSSDGGASFDAPYQEVPDLTAPVVQGSVLKLSAAADPAERVVFSAPGHPTARENLTLSTSADEAYSWQPGPRVYDGPSGYSDLVETGGAVGVLYENGDRVPPDSSLTYHQRITFAKVPVAQLGDPAALPPTTADTSGHGHDATVSGTPVQTDGVFGPGLEMSGDYLEAPHTGDLSFGDGPFTAAAWFRTTARSQQAVLWAHSTRDVDAKWWIRVEPEQQRIRAHVGTGAQSTLASAPGDFADGRWHHVALTRSEGAVTLYVDGAPAATAAPAAGSVSAGALTGIRAGARVDGLNNPLLGAADEVWLFRRALSAGQIGELATGNEVPGAEAAAVLHLPLDEVRGGAANAPPGER